MMRKGEWDRFWRLSLLPVVKQAQRVTAEHWRICMKPLLSGYSFQGRDVLELGCGSAKNSFTIFREYACSSVTLVDYNEHALRIARRTGPRAGVHLVQAHVVTVCLRRNFDLVHSSGLVEHFYGDDRRKVIGKHVEHARPGGLVMIWVPRRSLLCKLLETFNSLLMSIKEQPFTDQELTGLCRAVGLNVLRLRHKSLGMEVGVLAQKCEGSFAPEKRNGETGCAGSLPGKEEP